MKTNKIHTETVNEAALSQYINLCGEAAELLEYLTEFIDDHGEVLPDEVDETHVGNMKEVVARLQGIKKFISWAGGK